MLSAHTPVLLGRWGTRDFLRGRTKKGGAVHIRHTHGSKGRYKRLSTLYGLRDGRRHAGNHMKGGLGVKLGGGLFGMRVPRQHALSTMTRDEFELEVYGHPSITNPYRELMAEHPALKEVMANAAPRASLVVLLPRAPRHAGKQMRCSPSSLSLSASSVVESEAGMECDHERALPAQWKAVGDALASLLCAEPGPSLHRATDTLHDSSTHLRSDSLHGMRQQWRQLSSSSWSPSPTVSTAPWCVADVYLCTLDSSVHVTVPPVTDLKTLGDFMRAHLSALYCTYRRGRRLTHADAESAMNSTTAGRGASFSNREAVIRGVGNGISVASRNAKPFLGAALLSSTCTLAASLQPPGAILRSPLCATATPASSTTAGTSTSSPRVKLDALAARRNTCLAESTATNTGTLTGTEVRVVPSVSSTFPAIMSQETIAGGDTTAALASIKVDEEAGVASVWRSLRQLRPGSLCLCMRPNMFLSPIETLAEGHDKGESDTLHGMHRASVKVECTSASPSSSSPPISGLRRQPLLKRDTAYDEEVGVWRRHPRGSAADTMRWFYSNHDPRAHCSDALPHAQRRLPVLLLVDASKLQCGGNPDQLQKHKDSKAADNIYKTVPTAASAVSALVPGTATSLLSRQLSEELERAGFHALADDSLASVLFAMSRWATEQQWMSMLALRAGARDETEQFGEVSDKEPGGMSVAAPVDCLRVH